jgi:hypothetical protein
MAEKSVLSKTLDTGKNIVSTGVSLVSRGTGAAVGAVMGTPVGYILGTLQVDDLVLKVGDFLLKPLINTNLSSYNPTYADDARVCALAGLALGATYPTQTLKLGWKLISFPFARGYKGAALGYNAYKKRKENKKGENTEEELREASPRVSPLEARVHQEPSHGPHIIEIPHQVISDPSQHSHSGRVPHD